MLQRAGVATLDVTEFFRRLKHEGCFTSDGGHCDDSALSQRMWADLCQTISEVMSQGMYGWTWIRAARDANFLRPRPHSEFMQVLNTGVGTYWNAWQLAGDLLAGHFAGAGEEPIPEGLQTPSRVSTGLEDAARKGGSARRGGDGGPKAIGRHRRVLGSPE